MKPRPDARCSVGLALLATLAFGAGCEARKADVGDNSKTDGSSTAAFHLVDNEWAIRALAANGAWTFWIADVVNVETNPTRFPLSAVHACRTNDCRDTLRSVPLPAPSSYSPDPGPVIAANATQVFWDMSGTRSSFSTCPRPLCDAPGTAGFATDFALFTLDDDRLYFVSAESVIACSVQDCTSTERRYRMKAPAGEAPFTRASQLIADADRLYMVADTRLVSVAKDGQDTFDVITAAVDQGASIAVNDQEVFLSETGPLSKIYACPKTGCAGSPRVVVQNLQWPVHLLVLGDSLYIVESPWMGMGSPSAAPPYGKDRISRCPVAGCDAPEVLLETDPLKGPLVTDGEHVLFPGPCYPPQGTEPADAPSCEYIGVLQ